MSGIRPIRMNGTEGKENDKELMRTTMEAQFFNKWQGMAFQVLLREGSSITGDSVFFYKLPDLNQFFGRPPAFLKLSAAWNVYINYSSWCYCKVLVLMSLGPLTSHQILSVHWLFQEAGAQLATLFKHNPVSTPGPLHSQEDSSLLGIQRLPGMKLLCQF